MFWRLLLAFVGILIAIVAGYFFLRCFLDTNEQAISASATIVVALFTGLLAVSTYYLWDATKESARAATSAAESAKKTADAVLASDRARFFIVIDEHGFKETAEWAAFYNKSPEMNAENPQIKFHFENYGRTPGIVTEVGLGEIVIAREQPQRAFTIVEPLRGRYMIAAAGQTDVIAWTMSGKHTLGDFVPIVAGEACLWFHGHICYTEVFGSTTTYRFVFRYVRVDKSYRLQLFDYSYATDKPARA